MTPLIRVTIKHAAKLHEISLDPSSAASSFKESIYQATGIPVDRMKVMVKGGILKDDANMEKLAIKPGQVITVIGSAGPLPTAPSVKPVFLEDLGTDAVALASRDPPGLINLGQTCYLNSGLQVLRAMPELQEVLQQKSPAHSSPEGRLTLAMKNLFSGMGQTAQAVAPFLLLNSLRSMAPQFAEQDRAGGFAQQDADEAWTQIISALRASLPDSETSFIDRHMSVELNKTLSCAETEEEPPSTSHEQVLKLECNISISTNFLVSGILDNLDEQIEKSSPSLGRTAVYNQKSRLARLPTYLAVHMVRFYWRRDIQQKAKIMRKVKFPLQLDVLDLATEDLRKRILPINTAGKRILQDRDERARQSKRTKGSFEAIAQETQQRETERKAIEALAVEHQVEEQGTNPTALYELCAMVTHKGPSADSGHYIGWTRKENNLVASGEEEWYKFDDDKVSTVTAEKIISMDGGGEDSVAYILLYRSVC